MTKSSERARIELLRSALQTNLVPGRTLVGIGDDAAVIGPGSENLVWTIDAQVEGVHFRHDLVSRHDIGYRATMAAASDLAAMGASPVGILAALVLPETIDDDDLKAIAHGQAEAASAIGTRIIGGNLARGRELSITTTVLGEAPRPLLRSGALEGQTVAIAGPLGLAAAGLCLLSQGLASHLDARSAVVAFQRPTARIADGLRARGVASAAIDISDGLVADVGHIATASGVSVGLFVERLVSAELRRAAALAGKDPERLALYGGEDYALVITIPEGQTPPGFTPIGRVLSARGLAPCVGLLGLSDDDSALRPLEDAGFDHFS